MTCVTCEGSDPLCPECSPAFWVNSYVVVVTGSRTGFDQRLIRERLESLPEGSVVIQGGYSGVDTQVRDLCERLKITCVEVPADWNTHHKAAGPIRNRKMLDLDPDLVLAFHRHIENSKGTKDCYEEALKRKLTVELISGE
jgi:hypothetical protein